VASDNSSTLSTLIHLYQLLTAAGAVFFVRQNLFIGGFFNTNLPGLIALALVTETHNTNSDLL
jgi:hypothetical protein